MAMTNAQRATFQQRVDAGLNPAAPDHEAAVAALMALVIALDPEPDSGDICQVCRQSDAEYDEPHVADCPYVVARRLVGRGPIEDGGSALVGDPGERAAGEEG